MSGMMEKASFRNEFSDANISMDLLRLCFILFPKNDDERRMRKDGGMTIAVSFAFIDTIMKSGAIILTILMKNPGIVDVNMPIAGLTLFIVRSRRSPVFIPSVFSRDANWTALKSSPETSENSVNPSLALI